MYRIVCLVQPPFRSSGLFIAGPPFLPFALGVLAVQDAELRFWANLVCLKQALPLFLFRGELRFLLNEIFVAFLHSGTSAVVSTLSRNTGLHVTLHPQSAHASLYRTHSTLFGTDCVVDL